MFSSLALDPPPAPSSGRIAEADLAAGRAMGIPGLVGKAEIAEALQEALRQVLEAAEQLERGGGVLAGQLLQQIALLEHLQEQMGNLQQAVKGLQNIRGGAVGVLQVSRLVGILLDVKAFVFDLAPAPAALVGDAFDIGWLEALVGEPVVKLGPEMPEGFNPATAQGYDLPARRRLACTWVWS